MKDNFFKLYSNLPLNLRREIILVLGVSGPITWEVAYREINGDTKIGTMILQKLVNFKFVSA